VSECLLFRVLNKNKMPILKSPFSNESADIIERLDLLPHPEGGWYREVYRSDEQIQHDALPDRYLSSHCFSTSIYFLLEKNDFSAFHRISSDETWHFYLGSPIFIYCLFPDGAATETILGNNLIMGQQLQFTIQRNCWFAAKITGESDFSLVGCTVSPGFEFSDFELGIRANLLAAFPKHNTIIEEFTHD